ncbi:hypothetical protein OHB12_32665 [Nocardia sp. NBC_01730]|uniref:hypothetical protein n=1 Tax=Nocardia sp. NBC_01730 TaxID=2975998 RepID=UPI002E10448C|nr:hypothetical protein OHB12_32665 [Nocardia sp. NBC_01730]
MAASTGRPRARIAVVLTGACVAAAATALTAGAAAADAPWVQPAAPGEVVVCIRADASPPGTPVLPLPGILIAPPGTPILPPGTPMTPAAPPLAPQGGDHPHVRIERYTPDTPTDDAALVCGSPDPSRAVVIPPGARVERMPAPPLGAARPAPGGTGN